MWLTQLVLLCSIAILPGMAPGPPHDSPSFSDKQRVFGGGRGRSPTSQSSFSSSRHVSSSRVVTGDSNAPSSYSHVVNDDGSLEGGASSSYSSGVVTGGSSSHAPPSYSHVVSDEGLLDGGLLDGGTSYSYSSRVVTGGGDGHHGDSHQYSERSSGGGGHGSKHSQPVSGGVHGGASSSHSSSRSGGRTSAKTKVVGGDGHLGGGATSSSYSYVVSGGDGYHGDSHQYSERTSGLGSKNSAHGGHHEGQVHVQNDMRQCHILALSPFANENNKKANQKLNEIVNNVCNHILEGLKSPKQMRDFLNEYADSHGKKHAPDVTDEDFFKWMQKNYPNQAKELELPLSIVRQVHKTTDMFTTNCGLERAVAITAGQPLGDATQWLHKLDTEGNPLAQRFWEYANDLFFMYEGLINIGEYCESLRSYDAESEGLDNLLEHKLGMSEEDRLHAHLFCKLRNRVNKLQRQKMDHKKAEELEYSRRIKFEEYCEERSAEWAARHNKGVHEYAAFSAQATALVSEMAGHLKAAHDDGDQIGARIEDLIKELEDLLKRRKAQQENTKQLEIQIAGLQKLLDDGARAPREWNPSKMEMTTGTLAGQTLNTLRGKLDDGEGKLIKESSLFRSLTEDLVRKRYPNLYIDPEHHYPILTPNEINRGSVKAQADGWDCLAILGDFEMGLAGLGAKINPESDEFAFKSAEFEQLLRSLFEKKVLRCLMLWREDREKRSNPFFQYMDMLGMISHQNGYGDDEGDRWGFITKIGPGIEVSKKYCKTAGEKRSKSMSLDARLRMLCDMLYTVNQNGQLVREANIPGFGSFLENYFKHIEHAVATSTFTMAEAERANFENRNQFGVGGMGNNRSARRRTRSAKGKGKASRRARSSKHRSRKGRSNNSRNKRARKH